MVAAECLDLECHLVGFGGITKDNTIFYVAAFVVRRIKRVTNCDTCIKQLSGKPGNSMDAALLNVKLQGALHWPSNALFNCLRDIENALCSYTADRFTPFCVCIHIDIYDCIRCLANMLNFDVVIKLEC